MSLLAYFATPLALLGALWLWRVLRGRAPKRYALNVVLGLLLLAYFTVTSVLGIFWVARQELPVFDPHYVFGYLTLGLVVAHVGVNVQPMLKFVRQQGAKTRAAAPSGSLRSYRIPFVRIIGLAVVGALGFGLGLRRGSTELVAAERAPLPLPPAASAEARQDGSLPNPEPARDQLVTKDKQASPVSTYYHRGTTYDRSLLSAASTPIAWSKRPEPFKPFPGAVVVPLPNDFRRAGLSTSAVVEAARTPLRALYPKTVPLRDLSTLLQMTNGLTGAGGKTKTGGLYLTRAAPSAGALYPTLTYVIARNVEGLPAGLYHYDPKGSALQLVTAGDGHLSELARASAAPGLLRGASFALVFTTEYFRTSFKYGERSYRYSLLDAGHVAGNALLAAEYLGLSGRPVGRFDDARVNALLGLDASKEATLLIVPVGQREESDGSLDAEWPFVATPQNLASKDVPSLILLAHGRTALARREEASIVRPFPALAPLATREGRETLALPPPAATMDDLFATIERRRSARHWTDRGMTLEQLSTVLATSFGQTKGAADPSTEEHRAIRAYVIALRVQGLAPGAYAYDGASHTLRLRRAGLLKKETYEASLMQECAGDSDAVIVKTVDAARLPYPDGSRGYRYAGIDAGMAGERLYLSTVALGLGTTGIGAYFDDEVSELIAAPSNEEHVLYLSAIGVVPEGQ